jgi:hypothetical protein
MILQVGEKVHVLVRRRFESDVRRQLVGEVVAAGESLVRLRSFTYSFEPAFNLYSRSARAREQLVSLVDALNLITVIPAEVDLEKLEFRLEGNQTVLTDGHFSVQVEEAQGRR